MIRNLSLSILMVGLLQAPVNAIAQTYTLQAPNGNTSVKVAVTDSIRYELYYKNKAVVMPSVVAMELNNGTLGLRGTVIKATTRKVKRELQPLYGKSAKLNENYEELTLRFKGDYALVCRLYDEGFAYRFQTAFKDSVTVISERADFRLSGNPEAILAQTDNFTAWELPYTRFETTDKVAEGSRAISPALFRYPEGLNVVVAEADLLNYPGMYLQKQGNRMTGAWANYPSKVVMGSWGDFVTVVKDRAGFIAKTSGTRDYPWRVVMATDRDADLLNNQLVYKLSGPSKIKDPSWIKPGKAAWEWWHDAMLPGASIPSGMDNRNTALYKHYVDFAAANKLEYLMVDAGWSDNYNLYKVNPKMDVRELIRYAKTKNVDVLLWCVASTLMKDLDGQLDFLKEIGAAGVKVDFIDRDDQEAISWFETIASAAAKRKLVINFHGCSKPTGLQRAYPNIINYEAVRGAECSKWDFTANPDHHLIIPFVRMIAGPMDYTPGSMRNKTKEEFKPVDPGLPSSQGTRCHELAMFVVFDQPLAMLCDSPEEYVKYPDVMKFLSAVPTVFDETRVLDAKVGDYALMAKRKGKKWFIGGMTNWDSRKLKLDFSFLPDNRNYQVDLYTDAADAGVHAGNYTFKTITVNKKTVMDIDLANGGGMVAQIY